MVTQSRLLLTVSLLLVNCDGRNIWSPFMSVASAATQLRRQPDLCHHLLTVMEEVKTAAPLSCKTLPDSVGGNILHMNTTSLHMSYLGVIMKFCTMSAVEMVKGCKNKRKGTECLVNAFTQVLKRTRGIDKN